MKLAVRKEESIHPGNFHYMLMPIRFDTGDFDARVWELMGHVIIEVPDETGERLLKEAGAALRHQYEVAVFTEEKLKKK